VSYAHDNGRPSVDPGELCRRTILPRASASMPSAERTIYGITAHVLNNDPEMP
jgi:hypothetical protein